MDCLASGGESTPAKADYTSEVLRGDSGPLFRVSTRVVDRAVELVVARIQHGRVEDGVWSVTERSASAAWKAVILDQHLARTGKQTNSKAAISGPEAFGLKRGSPIARLVEGMDGVLDCEG